MPKEVEQQIDVLSHSLLTLPAHFFLYLLGLSITVTSNFFQNVLTSISPLEYKLREGAYRVFLTRASAVPGTWKILVDVC